MPAKSQVMFEMPGFTWGQLRSPSSRQPEEKDNELVEGAINQGINWLQISERARVNSFVQLDFTRDTKRFDYNNKLKFALGTQLQLAVLDWVTIAIGGKYEWDRRYVTNRTPKGFLWFVNWFAERSWRPDHQPGTPKPTFLAYTLSTWGQFSYPSSQEVEENRNAIIEGAIEVAADFWKPNDLLVFSAFTGMDFKGDKQGFDFNNKLEPGIGARLRFNVRENARVEIGAKFVNDYRFVTHRSESGTILFLNWAATW